MEEAVTKRFVHEDSSSVTSLCAAVEACLSQGIRRRALGLFKTSSTTALLHKVAKNFDSAAVISKKVQEIENSDPNRRSSSSSDSLVTTRSASNAMSSSTSLTRPSLNKKSSSSGGLSQVQLPRYLWIRLALFEKVLAKIIDHLVQNSSKYYEKDALVADPDYGSILSSLLDDAAGSLRALEVGNCVVEPDVTGSRRSTNGCTEKALTRVESGNTHRGGPCESQLFYRRPLDSFHVEHR
ncbi:hypothetical protein V9T40_006501 [Parthenolecanium corni]|uniref:RUN domain-containing protein n=1 Tax=Parthenolecanium corni TaxID=536013 RepID=A0AAN9Y7Q0_9HEMI